MVRKDYVCKLLYVIMTLFLSLSFSLSLSLSLSPLPPVSSNLDVVIGLSSSPSSPSTPAQPEFLSQLQVQGSLAEGEGQRSAEGASLVDQCSDLYNNARHKDGVSYTFLYRIYVLPNLLSIVVLCMLMV